MIRGCIRVFKSDPIKCNYALRILSNLIQSVSNLRKWDFDSFRNRRDRKFCLACSTLTPLFTTTVSRANWATTIAFASRILQQRLLLWGSSSEPSLSLALYLNGLMTSCPRWITVLDGVLMSERVAFERGSTAGLIPCFLWIKLHPKGSRGFKHVSIFFCSVLLPTGALRRYDIRGTQTS